MTISINNLCTRIITAHLSWMEPQQNFKYDFPTTLSFITIIFTVVASEIPSYKPQYCTLKNGNVGPT